MLSIGQGDIFVHSEEVSWLKVKLRLKMFKTQFVVVRLFRAGYFNGKATYFPCADIFKTNLEKQLVSKAVIVYNISVNSKRVIFHRKLIVADFHYFISSHIVTSKNGGT